jgi:hypothetical protein
MIMHCSQCKTIIDEAVLIAKTIYGTEDTIEALYCKKCFKQSFVNG